MNLKDFAKRIKHPKHPPNAGESTPAPLEDTIEINGKKFVKVKLLIDHTADEYVFILEQTVTELRERLKGSIPKWKFEKLVSDLQTFNINLKHELNHLADRYLKQKNSLQNYISENDELIEQLKHLQNALYEKEELPKRAQQKNNAMGNENTQLKLKLFKEGNFSKVKKLE